MRSYRKTPKPEASNLGNFLEGQYGRGKTSAHEVAQAAASTKGNHCNGLAKLQYNLAFRKNRVRRDKLKPDTRNIARDLNRILYRRSELYPAYRVKVAVWDATTDSRTEKYIKILPIHETLDSLIKPGCEQDWASLDDDQHVFF